jgi:hypothetical protein
VLRDLASGDIPQRLAISGALPEPMTTARFGRISALLAEARMVLGRMLIIRPERRPRTRCRTRAWALPSDRAAGPSAGCSRGPRNVRSARLAGVDR